MSGTAIVYGAAGYTGTLVSRELARRGTRHVVAGRSERGLAELARGAGAPFRVFSTEDAAVRESALADARVLLNCAGPFSRTSASLARACIARGVTYFDLSGEVDEHLEVLALDADAKKRGVLLVPGVGFGVIPTEIAAAIAVAKLGGRAKSLTIAYETQGDASRGTLETVLGRLHEPGVVRRDGELRLARAFTESTNVDFGEGEKYLVSNPWRADLVSAFVSLGVPDISTFANFPFAARFLGKLPGFLRSGPGRSLVRSIIDRAPLGPSEASLAAGKTHVMARATDETGASAEVFVHGPEAYVFTARLAATAVERALSGLEKTGVSAPSGAFGRDFLSSIDGVTVKA
jgi:short subunit dehydrogenase-like uncharacterized protein